jgi:hypothetical protein
MLTKGVLTAGVTVAFCRGSDGWGQGVLLTSRPAVLTAALCVAHTEATNWGSVVRLLGTARLCCYGQVGVACLLHFLVCASSRTTRAHTGQEHREQDRGCLPV